MTKTGSLQDKDLSSGSAPANKYDYLKTVVNVARKNGWDIEGLGLIGKDLEAPQPEDVSRKQALATNRIVTSVLKRFSKILTPPVPADLEKSLRKKGPKNLLPWEQEVLDKAEKWRRQVKKHKPEIVQELRRAIVPDGK